MTTVPHGVADLYLAPVVISIDERIDELSQLSMADLEERVALYSNRPDWTREDRETGLLETMCYLIDCHKWLLEWDKRGLRLTHGDYSVVLGVPQSFRDYIEAAPVNQPVNQPVDQPVG